MNFEKYKDALKESVARMNAAADHKAKADNNIEYGRIQVFVLLLEDMGHTIVGRVTKDKETGLRRFIYLMLDGQKIGEVNNETGSILGLTEEAPEDPEEKVEP